MIMSRVIIYVIAFIPIKLLGKHYTLVENKNKSSIHINSVRSPIIFYYLQHIKSV